MKKILLYIILVTGLSACASHNIYEQAIESDSAELYIAPVRQVENELGPHISVDIDGQRTSYTEPMTSLMVAPTFVQINPIRIAPGEHRVLISVTSYPKNRAKYATIEETINFEPNTSYILHADIPSVPPKEFEDDSHAIVSVTEKSGNKIALQQNLILKDSWGRSPSGMSASDWSSVSGAIISGIPWGL